MKQHLDSATVFLKKHLRRKPRAALFLGTGLGSLAGFMRGKVSIPYEKIPCFPRPSAFGQKNALLCGDIGGTCVVSFEGRFHAYEGHSFWEIGFPVRVAHALGAKTILCTNIAGGINLSFKCGDLAVIDDHINLMGGNPLLGRHESWMGEKFVDLSEPYDKNLIVKVEEAAKSERLEIKRGVYAAVLGPHLETRAEYRYLRQIGADLVGMSTVPEVLVARQLGMRVAALSVVSDECDPDNLKPVEVPELLRLAKKAQKPLAKILVRLIRELKGGRK